MEKERLQEGARLFYCWAEVQSHGKVTPPNYHITFWGMIVYHPIKQPEQRLQGAYLLPSVPGGGKSYSLCKFTVCQYKAKDITLYFESVCESQ